MSSDNRACSPNHPSSSPVLKTINCRGVCHQLPGCLSSTAGVFVINCRVVYFYCLWCLSSSAVLFIFFWLYHQPLLPALLLFIALVIVISPCVAGLHPALAEKFQKSILIISTLQGRCGKGPSRPLRLLHSSEYRRTFAESKGDDKASDTYAPLAERQVAQQASDADTTSR